MAYPVLIAYDFNKNEIQNPRLQNLASNPSSPVTGQFYYYTTDHVLRFYNGTGWITLGTLDQISTAAADVALGSHKITGLSDGSGANDAVNKGQLDAVSAAISAVAAGISWKDSVRAASATNVALSNGLENGDSVGGVTLATGDRVALVGQTAGAENGIYVAVASGAASRSADAATAAAIQGTFVPVEEGTNAGKIYYLATDPPITLGTTALTFTEFTGATYVAGAGLTLSGVTFAVGAGTGITVNADDVAINTAVVATKYAVDVGDNSSTDIVVTHNLPGGRDVIVQVYDKTTPYQEVGCDKKRTSTTTVTLTFSVAPTSNQYRCVITG